MEGLSNYPLSSQPSLLTQFVNKPLSSIATPAAIIDRAIVRRNCDAMLNVCKELGVGFRAHVKSHKTYELAELQVGTTGPANFVVSTMIEAENLATFVTRSQAQGRLCSILYGVPIPQSAIPRLLNLANLLAPGTLSILIDNLAAFEKLSAHLTTSPQKIGIYIKIDTGYHRAGIQTTSPAFPPLVHAVVSSPHSPFRGFYSHYGHSYAGSSEDDAATGLIDELAGLKLATHAVPDSFKGAVALTVGATPTATAAQNLLLSASPRALEFRRLLEELKSRFSVELHAGVYPLLDLQQVATHARPAALPTSTSTSTPGFQPLSKNNIALRILLEVTSIYTERSQPEALVSAGSLALGREPCKSYPGWAIVAPQLGNSATKSVYEEGGDRTGWIVGKISQEHGILTWEGERAEMNALAIGDKVCVWPNHACVAGAGFGWYLVVDSDLEREGGEEKVVDVWVRWRGW